MSYPYGSGSRWPPAPIVSTPPPSKSVSPDPEPTAFPDVPPDPRAFRRGAWMYAGCVATVVLTLAAALTVAFVAGHKPDITHLTEAMLLDKSQVPPLSGGSWERQLHDTVPASAGVLVLTVTPRECESPFQMNGTVRQFGTAQWTKLTNGPMFSDISFGVTISVPPKTDNAALDRWADSCSSFEIGIVGLTSKASVHRLDISGLPKWAVAYSLAMGDHGTPGAGVVGIYRGVMVHAFYGSYGATLDPAIRDGLSKIFKAQVAKLMAV